MWFFWRHREQRLDNNGFVARSARVNASLLLNDEFKAKKSSYQNINIMLTQSIIHHQFLAALILQKLG